MDDLLPHIISSCGHEKYLREEELLGASYEQLDTLGQSKSVMEQQVPDDSISDGQKLCKSSMHSFLHLELSVIG